MIDMNDLCRANTVNACTRAYALLADLYKTTDDYFVSEDFRAVHADFINVFDLDTEATPDRVIIAVYAHYRAHGGEVTARKLMDNFKFVRPWASCPHHTLRSKK